MVTPSFWIAPEMWRDETVFIIGGGPSLTGMDLSPIHKRPVIGVNNAYTLGPWIDIIFFGDLKWWPKNKMEAMAHPAGIIITIHGGSEVAAFRDRVKIMKKVGRNGIYPIRDGLAWNKNSGACAINLAIHFGAKKIVLLGFDMKMDTENGFNHGHNWHKAHMAFGKPPRSDIYENRFLPPFRDIKRDLDYHNSKNGRQIEILNATLGSALDLFPKTTLNILAMEEKW